MSEATLSRGSASRRRLPDARQQRDRIGYGQAFSELLTWIRSQDFKGWDPYDGCNTRYEWLRGNWHVRFLLTYVNKFSPLNFRPLLGIAKRYNYCGLALINRALMRVGDADDVRPIVERNLEIILGVSLVQPYGVHCWNGNRLHIQWRNLHQKPDLPDSIGTIFCAGAILDYCGTYGGTPELHAILADTRRFFLDRLLTARGGDPFFRYNPVSPEHELTFNASIKSAVFLAEIDRYLGIDGSEDIVKQCVDFVVSFQRPDGAWMMGIDFRSGSQRHQIDFHQGFILDAIKRYMELTAETQELRAAYERGLRFYLRQFRPDGGSYYRYPRRWPSNIHDQAQGIITFSKASAIDPEYGRTAERIADWTIRKMRHRSGYFYYHKYPVFANRIPFIRWGQAWMLYALSYLQRE